MFVSEGIGKPEGSARVRDEQSRTRFRGGVCPRNDRRSKHRRFRCVERDDCDLQLRAVSGLAPDIPAVSSDARATLVSKRGWVML
jgi:hypothetical protein